MTQNNNDGLVKRIIEKNINRALLVGVIVATGLLVHSHWQGKEIDRKYKELIGIKEKYEQLSRSTAKLAIEYAESKNIAKEVEKRFKDVIQEKDDKIKLLSDATYHIGKHVLTQNGPDYHYNTPKMTQNYVLNEIRLQGNNSPAIGYIMIKSDGKVYKRNYDIKVEVEQLQTVNEETGRVKVHTKAYLTQEEVSPLKKRIPDYDDWQGKKFPLDIIGGTALIDPTIPGQKKRLFLWAPTLNAEFLGVAGDLGKMLPGISLSVGGYGVSKRDLDWKLLHIGITTDIKGEGAYLSLTPFSYRFSPNKLKNTYIGPGVAWRKDSTDFLLNINIGF